MCVCASVVGPKKEFLVAHTLSSKKSDILGFSIALVFSLLSFNLTSQMTQN